MGQHTPADHSRGDANTVGGYRLVHDRPAAFEGPDGFSYSVETLAEPTGEAGTWGGYLLFVRWSRVGASAPAGHLETDWLVRARSEAEALVAVGALRLADARRELEALVRDVHGGAEPARRWWDAMRDGADEETVS